MDIRIEQDLPAAAAVVEFDADPQHMSEEVGRAFEEVVETLGSSSVSPAGMPFSLYTELEPDDEGRWHVVSGIPVAQPVPAVGRVEPFEIPGGTVAVATHVGPYDTLARTYELMQREVVSLGYTPSGPMWEYYFTDPQTEPDPKRWRTDIHMRIEPVGAG